MTISMILRGRILVDDRFIDDGVLLCEGDRIKAVGERADIEKRFPQLVPDIDQADQYEGTFIPGLVDVHCHGGGGESFPNAESREQAMTAIMEHRRHGTTSLVASCVTASPQVLMKRGRLLGQLAAEGQLAGVHYEGPFVSHERKGAQDPTYIAQPDPELTRQLIEVGQGYVVTMTLAPEKEGAWGPNSVAEVLIEGGAVPSWGHTDAAPEAARHALEFSRQSLARVSEEVRRCGRATVTHLFNGMRPLHHRDPGPIMEFISDAARGGAIVEMICDGVHLNPQIVRTVWETVGRDSCVLITDAMAAAGMADGSYELGSQAVTVADGVARLTHGGSIAGGTAHLIDCVRTAVQVAHIPLEDAIYMASAQGATIVGSNDIGALREGTYADIVLIDEDIRPLAVWHRGEKVE
ncbi:N-acetylglucosamine-6-phosphate deacetylase [Schaalia sp. lx-100]|uniref:N-acetylglucosamine-6-phosphate deacetylase n=1 Tax=Schaalia sp. lx-100 TaxID=2899081 RepID=UPI001E644941|nr:amidohydrolase family protein [Schaalia sp. lx-100]MCD4556702.1 amidohydrolase family protein [Schaalia sp. lx-100]